MPTFGNTDVVTGGAPVIIESKGIQTFANFGDQPDLSEISNRQHLIGSKFDQDSKCELNQAQILLLDKLNLQSIIDNKNLAHAVTALDLYEMEGKNVIVNGTN